MSDVKVLVQKQDELKDQIAAGEYKYFSEKILDGIGYAIQKITRRRHLPSFWYSILVIALFTLAVFFLSSIFFSETQLITSPMIFWFFWVIISSSLALGIVNNFMKRFFQRCRNNIIDAVESVDDLLSFQQWLASLSNIKSSLAVILFSAIAMGLYTPSAIAMVGLHKSFTVPLIIAMIIIGSVNGMMVSYMFPFISLPSRLSEFKYKLFGADPSSSEIITHLSEILGNFVFLMAIIMAIGTTNVLITGFLSPTLMLPILLPMWILITVMFFNNQFALTKIITRAKWKKLNDVQRQIEELELGKNIVEKETMETINRLLDYHNKIKSTPKSSIELRTILNFLNSLLLPFLAFILGNLETLKEFIS